MADEVEISVTTLATIPQNENRLNELKIRAQEWPVKCSPSQSYMCSEEIQSKLIMKICALQLWPHIAALSL